MPSTKEMNHYIFYKQPRVPIPQAIVFFYLFQYKPTVTFFYLQVVLAARREKMLEAVAAEIRAAGGEAVVVVSDASKARYSKKASENIFSISITFYPSKADAARRVLPACWSTSMRENVYIILLLTGCPDDSPYFVVSTFLHLSPSYGALIARCNLLMI